MGQPRPYGRTKNFTENLGSETDHSALNAELDAAGNSIADIRTNIAILQADDGKLRPAVVTSDSISAELRASLVAGVTADTVALRDAAQTSANSAAGSATTATTRATEAAASAATASTKAGDASTSANNAANSAANAASSVSAAGLPSSLAGQALNWLRVKANELGYELRTSIQHLADIGAAAAGPLATSGITGAAGSGANVDINQLNALTSINGSHLAGWKNRLINGNFAINRRAVAGTVTLAAGVYGHDRWKAGAGGCTYTFAASGIDTIITVTAGSLMQVIAPENIEGGVYRLSQQGTAQARIAVNGAATSGAYAANPQSSASATANQAVTVEFTLGTIDRAQLEMGTVATLFERRAPLEPALCQLYYRTSAFSMQAYQAAGNNFYQTVEFQTMRATPSITTSATTYFNASTVSAIANGPSSIQLGASATALGVCQVFTNWAASAEL